MSTQVLGATEMPADLLAISERATQIQTLLSRVGSEGSTSSFAAALEEASAGPAATTTYAQPSGAPVAPASTFPGGYSQVPAATLTPVASATATDSSSYDGLIEQAATRYGLDPAILHGLIQQESGFDPGATSSAGAEGLTQLMPGTASSMGITEPLNPAQSIEGGARYLSQLMSQFGGNVTDALAAYNAGPGAVQQYGGVPPYSETQSYVSKVLGYAEGFRQSQTATTPSVQLT